MIDEDKKLILEWCGATFFGNNIFKMVEGAGGFSVSFWKPCLDFYRWRAMPKLVKYELSKPYRGALHFAMVCTENGVEYRALDKDPAEAFGQALLKLIKEIK